MPTYYSCGTLFSEEPYGEDSYLDESCGCEDDCDSDSPPDHSLASEAASMVSNTSDALLPDMQVPQTRREVSCEWEGSSGVFTAYEACQLVENGASCEHHGDGTCDGEVVFGRLRLWDELAARRYARSVAVIDELRTQGAIRVGFNAGHHIHVAARDSSSGRGLSPNNLVSLYAVFAHCEDLLYRLAAAGWSQHRCEQDGAYSGPLYKLGAHMPRTAKNVGNRIANERYQGLNVSPYVDAISRCGCGAYRFGEWESCECHDNRMTVEWRLWNASVSPRKIRAYCAISAVLTDYAASVDSREVVQLEENEWQGTSYVNEAALYGQLDYLVSRPGFSKRDRADIRWLASIAPGMGDIGRDYLTSRAGISSYEATPVVA